MIEIEPYRELWKREEQDNKELREAIEKLNKDLGDMTKLFAKEREKNRQAIEYATKRQEWLMNSNYQKIGTHNYINFALEIIEILKGE